MLASNAREAGGELVGDPIETALVAAAAERGLAHDELLAATSGSASCRSRPTGSG